MHTLLLFFLISVSKLVSNNAISLITSCPNCGDYEVPYPLSTNEDCGDPNYKIHCNNNATLEFISATNNSYKIQKIDPIARKFVITPPLILSHTCFSSDLYGGGFQLDETLPFNISTQNTVILLNCSDNILQSPLNCSSTSICREFEKVGEGSGCLGTLCCHYLKDSAMTSHRIRVRTGGCTAYTCLVGFTPDDPVESWNYGIEIQWMVPPN